MIIEIVSGQLNQKWSKSFFVSNNNLKGLLCGVVIIQTAARGYRNEALNWRIEVTLQLSLPYNSVVTGTASNWSFFRVIFLGKKILFT